MVEKDICNILPMNKLKDWENGVLAPVQQSNCDFALVFSTL